MKTNRIVTAALLCLLIGPFARAQEDVVTQRAAKLDQLFKNFASNNKFMGAVAVRQDGKQIFHEQYGVIATDPETTPNDETQYRVGSITKTFTAVMVMQLIEEGKLSLDTKLSDFFVQPKNADQITIRQMLGHRSGLFSITDNPSYMLWHTTDKSRDDMLKIIEDHPIKFEPGERTEYSNTNYVLLGFIIEKLTESTYAEQLQKRICEPLGLKRTAYMTAPDAAKNVATAFTRRDEKWQPEVQTNPSVPAGAGAIMSTAADLTVFIEALFNGKLVSEESLIQMKPAGMDMGLGLFGFPFGPKRALGHNGGISGFQSNVAYFADDQVAIAMLGNGFDMPMNDILIGMLSTVFGEPYEMPSFEEVEVAEELLQRYVGEFTSDQIPLKLNVTVKDGKLVVQGSGQPPIPVVATSETEFRADMVGAKLRFEQSEDNTAYDRMTLQQGGAEIKFKKQSR